MTSGEVRVMLHALRKAGIHVVALHDHMFDEQPPYDFMQFPGKGSAVELARGSGVCSTRRLLQALTARIERQQDLPHQFLRATDERCPQRPRRT
jgi:hypothetical protein